MVKVSWRFRVNERQEPFRREDDPDGVEASAHSYDLVRRYVEISGSSDAAEVMRNCAAWLDQHEEFKLSRVQFAYSHPFYYATLISFPYEDYDIELTIRDGGNES